MSALMWPCFFAVLIVASEFETLLFSLLISAITMTLLTSFFYRKEFVLLVKSSFFKSSLTSGITLLLTYAILGLVNYLVVHNDYMFDITRSKIHTLSNKSKKVLKMIGQKEIQLELFASHYDWDRYLNLLDLYTAERANISLKFYDIEKELGRVNLYGIQKPGTLVVHYNNKQYKVVATNELAVTNLLYRIFNPVKKNIYYSVGHNEISLFDKNQLGADFLRAKIVDAQFILKPLELHKGIPKDASVVMVLNPQVDFLSQEIHSLKSYIESGGRLLVTLSPSFSGVTTKKLLSYLNKLGVEFYNGIILDRLAPQQGSQVSIPIVNQYAKHEVSKDFVGRTFFPITGYIETRQEKHRWTDLVKSTPFPGSWGETNFDELKSGKAKFHEASDQKGPLTILALGENLDNGSKILVSASTSFISNKFQGQAPNFNLFLNGLSWMADQDGLISLDRPGLTGDLVYISGIHLSFIFYFVILIFPFIFFGIGFYFYRKRMNS